MSNNIPNQFIKPENTERSQNNKITGKKVSGSPTEGKITATIGVGENAKNSFIWVTIKWSFLIGAATTLAIYFRPTYCQAELQGNLLDDIKSTWSIFMPVITLALGYTFGKGN
ncbi:MAG: hypothetical protein NTV43_08300 [Methylococcales bacterium]|nr:hypothetical protein [Methylococcales bacterium]